MLFVFLGNSFSFTFSSFNQPNRGIQLHIKKRKTAHHPFILARTRKKENKDVITHTYAIYILLRWIFISHAYKLEANKCLLI